MMTENWGVSAATVSLDDGENDAPSLEEARANQRGIAALRNAASALIDSAEERDRLRWRLDRLVDRCNALGHEYGMTGTASGEVLEGVLNALNCAEHGCHAPGETEEQRIAWCSEVERLTAEVARYREALTPSAETKAAYLAPSERYRSADGTEFSVPWLAIKDIMAAIQERAKE